MAKKKEDAKEVEPFNLEEALEKVPLPEYYKRAFLITCDTSKIKSQSDLDKMLKTYGEMK